MKSNQSGWCHQSSPNLNHHSSWSLHLSSCAYRDRFSVDPVPGLCLSGFIQVLVPPSDWCRLQHKCKPWVCALQISYFPLWHRDNTCVPPVFGLRSSHLLSFDPFTVTEGLPAAMTHLQRKKTRMCEFIIPVLIHLINWGRNRVSNPGPESVQILFSLIRSRW